MEELSEFIQISRKQGKAISCVLPYIVPKKTKTTRSHSNSCTQIVEEWLSGPPSVENEEGR